MRSRSLPALRGNPEAAFLAAAIYRHFLRLYMCCRPCLVVPSFQSKLTTCTLDAVRLLCVGGGSSYPSWLPRTKSLCFARSKRLAALPELCACHLTGPFDLLTRKGQVAAAKVYDCACWLLRCRRRRAHARCAFSRYGERAPRSRRRSAEE
eukprot:6177475-Pleurochrysis_carterae.AAC.6